MLRFPLQVGPAVVAWVVLRCQAVAAAPGGDCRPQAVEEEEEELASVYFYRVVGDFFFYWLYFFRSSIAFVKKKRLRCGSLFELRTGRFALVPTIHTGFFWCLSCVLDFVVRNVLLTFSMI